MSGKEKLHLDESELSNQDNKDLYLFQWLSEAEKALKQLSTDEIKDSQAGFESTLIKIVTGAASYPPLGHPSRHVAARSVVLLYVKGDTKTLYDALQSFMKTAGDVKSTENDAAKIASLFCIGELMLNLSAQIASFVTDIALLTVKLTKATSNSVLLRYHALSTLRKSMSAASKAATESAVKEVLKMTRNLLSDKALCIQRVAAELLVVLYPSGDRHRSASEIESLVQLSIKALDSADQRTRRTLSLFAGHILASSQVERAAPPPEVSKKPTKGKDKDADDDDDDIAPAPPISSDAPKMIMSITEMFGVISTAFNKFATSRKTRIGLFDFYVALLSALGPSFVENNYSTIVKHLMETIVHYAYPRNLNSRHDILVVRHGVSIILRDLIATRILSEQGQIGAIRDLATNYLKKWPALLPGEKEPKKEVLVIALREVAGLVAQMGNAPPPVQDSLSQPLVQLLGHRSYSVRVAAAWALRSFCYSTPLRLPKMVLSVLELLQKDISALPNPSAPPDVFSKALGHAYGLAALFAVIPERPLYVSYDLSAKVLDMATQLLKKASDHDVKIADVEIEIAWVCIASLMSLGPNFVKAHLPQLLVLWRNALPKPTSKDTASNNGRGVHEWMFLLHVRESALGAISAFLAHNSPTLVTLDVTRRLSSLLSNAVGFANAFMSQKTSLEIPENLADVGGKGVTPTMREASLRRRAYDCFSLLGFAGLAESTQATLLQGAISLFGTSEGYAGSAMQAAIASSGGTVSSIWQSADSYGYGVTSLTTIGGSDALDVDAMRANWDSIENALDKLFHTPVLPSCEHDSLVLCDLAYSVSLQSWPQPVPATTAVVDSSIKLFAKLLPLQDTSSIIKMFKQLVDGVKSPRLDRNTGRRTAVFVNAAIAILITLRTVASANSKQGRESLGNSQVVPILAGFLKDAIVNSDDILRAIGSEAIGRLASFTGTSFLASQMTSLYETVVKNRDPSARAGCALTYGAIHTYVGGLAAGPLLKTTVDILVTLSNDPHPVVHYWALYSLSQVVSAASLSYSPFISGTLGLLFNAYSMPTHEDGGGVLSSANLRSTLPTHQALCQIIDGIIAVMGPELQEPSRTRSLVLELVQEFTLEADDGIRVEAIKCIQHFLIFAAESVDIAELVGQLRVHLSSSCRPLKLASINALYQLVQKDALLMSKMGGDQLVEDLFRMLDEDATVDGVRNIILSWLQQTASLNPSAWIDLCQRIMARTTAAQEIVTAATRTAGLHDDEGESLGAGLANDSAAGGSTLTSRWRTQLFALQCLHNICVVVSHADRREHLDLVFARSQKIPTGHLLVSRVTDLIKMAFTASAAYVTEIRLEGLVVLRDIIETFSSSPDPDYSDAPLLEQHQAPITAALTPAFSSDSTPEILASAIQVCGVFVGSGIIKEMNRMGRILKLLTSALEQSKETAMLTIGDAKQFSPNASVMLRIATATAWAELEIASYQRTYLKDVVGPHHKMLSSLWIASLRDYASIRGDSEMLQDSSSVAMDSAYLALGREVLLPYYDSAWLPILKAVANAMSAGEPTIFEAMDGGEGVTSSKATPIRREPRALFYVLFGLVYETLANTAADVTSTTRSRENAIIALQALKSLVQPQFCGAAILDPPIFEEFNSLCYRMSMTETAAVQVHLVEVVASLARTQGPAIRLERHDDSPDWKLSPDSPLTHCLRICAYILRQNIPTTRTPLAIGEENHPKDRLAVLKAAFNACATIGQALGTACKEEVRAVAVALYADLLKSESCDWDIVGPTLPSLKGLLDFGSLSSSEKPVTADSKYSQLIHGLLSSCLSNIEDMRGREGVIPMLKMKNNLLVAVLILTVVPPNMPLSRPAVEYCCSILCQKLSEEGDISLTAAHCCKTLLLTATSPDSNRVFKHCTHLVIPGMIRFISSVAADDLSENDRRMHAVDEVLKALHAFFGGVPEEHKARLLAVLLPTTMLLLSSERLHRTATDSLLTLASAAPQAFKEATGKLDDGRRGVLEGAIREAVAERQGAATGNAGAGRGPTIALKTF